MKQIFRKIATIAASALMIGSTAGFAAAANYPAPFVQGGAANVAVVYGANAALSDVVGAANIGSNLATALAAQTAGGSSTSTSVSGGDSYKFEKTSTKFHLGNGIVDVASASVTKSNLPTLLADGVYLDSNNNEFDFTQKVTMANLSVTMFEDSDYKADVPTVGIKVASGAPVLNTTLTFTDQPKWSDLATTNLPILGKTYYVLAADNSSATETLTLLDSAQTTVLAEGESASLTANGKTYEASVNFIGSSTVKLSIGGEVTNSLSAGQTYKLKDGSYVGIKEILYNSKDSGVSKVEFSIGSGRLLLTDASEIQMNEDTVSGVKAYLTSSSGKLSSIVIEWNADDALFVTEDSSPEMPGFKVLKLSFGGMTYPTTEVVTVKSGDDERMVLSQFPLKSSTEDIDLVYADATGKNYTGAGKSATAVLRTTGRGNITFDKHTDQYFVASWNDGSSAESYLMKADSFTTTSGVNKTTFYYKNGGSWTSIATDVSPAETVTLGSVDLTVGTIIDSEKSVVIAPGSGVTFNKLFSKEGLQVVLPWTNSTAQVGSAAPVCGDATFKTGQIGPINVTNGTTASTGLVCYATTFPLVFTEEDKSENIASGATITATLGFNSATTPQTSVTAVSGLGGTNTEIESSNVFRNFAYSALATESLWDKTGDQYSLKLNYHGGESYANLYITSPEAVVSSTTNPVTNLGSATYSDAEVASVAGKNLIVIGGSCINSVAAELLGSAACSADFTTLTGIAAGEAIIKSFDRSGKTALLVAGYNAADTTKAITYLTNKAVDTTVGGKGLKVTSATEATAIVA